MGKLNDITVQLEESGIPEEVYREATVADALRLLNDDSVSLEKVDGVWKLTSIEYEED